jgi:hypothetical protein
MGVGGKSGEYSALAQIAEELYQRLDERVTTIVDKFEDHAKEVTGQLAAGDKTMALLNQSVQEVKADVGDLSAKVESNSAVVNHMQLEAANYRKRGDTTPHASSALEPKIVPPGFMTELGKFVLQGAVLALVTAIMFWVFRGGAAAIVTDPPDAPAHAKPKPQPTTPP